MHSLRLLCTGRPEAGLTAATGTCPPAVWDSDDLELHVWLDSGRLVNGVRTAFDVATLATLRLEMRETPETETMLCAAKELTSFTTCTLDEFKAATGQHATFEFSSTDTNFAATLDQVWISIVGEDTDGKRHTFTAGYLAIVRNGDSTSTDPVQDPINPYALYAFKTIAVAGQSNVVADTRDDTLTLAAGSGITITTNASTDTITITLASHTHAISDVTGLQTALDAKAAASHTHAISDVTGLQTALDAKAAASHTHAISDVTGLQTALDAKAASTHTHLSADVTDASSGGNGVADAAKLAKYNVSGDLSAGNFRATASLVAGVAGSNDGTVALYAENNASGVTIITASEATAQRVWNHTDSDGTYASQEWVTAQSYLATNGNGSGLTALNATQLTSGTIPDARFPATLPAASGVNLTALNMDNAGSGTLPVARGGTGATNLYALRRSMMLSMARYPSYWWTALNISGTTTSGVESTSFFPFIQIAAATAGKIRMYQNVSGSGPVWPGISGQPDFDRKMVANLQFIAQLSAHADSRISLHWTHSSVLSHTSLDRTVEGISICFKGGASAGTVWIQTHNGSGTADSSTASFPINDTTAYAWTLEWEPGVGVRLYKNGVLQCTASSNLPSGLGAANSNGAVFIAENTTNGTGNVTFLRYVDGYFSEIP